MQLQTFKLYIIIYNAIIYFIQPAIWIQLLYNSRTIPEYKKNWLERYGFYQNKIIKPNSIVLHAVSIGETLATQPLIQELQKYYPNITITLTSMTPFGLAIAQKIQSKNHYIQCIYLPYDLPCAMKRFINTIKPQLVIIMETELWPNLINTLYKHKIPIIIANARLSFNSFIKYKKIKYFFSNIIQKITIITAQYNTDANHFLKLGYKKSQLHIIGNLKFDITIKQNILIQQRILANNTWIKNRLIWIAGSTHSGEEILLLQTHKILLNTFPNLLMILSPRNPKRFTSIIKIIKKFNFSYHIIQDNNFIATKNTQIILNNTIGNLTVLYGIANIAFVGGSLIPHGGHNPLEPAAYSIPIIMGPHTFNFHDICIKLYQEKGLFLINNTESLVHTLSILLNNNSLRVYHGHCAIKTLEKNKGTLKKLIHIIRNNFLIH